MSKYCVGDHDPYNYFPVKDGEIKPSSSFIQPLPYYNNTKDNIFQFDDKFPVYRNLKLRSKAENVGRYYQTKGITDKKPVYEFIINTLVKEWPQYFQYTHNLLLCKQTGESLCFLNKQEYIPEKSKTSLNYEDGFDALCMQVQEDCMIHSISDTSDFIDTIHLHYPNGFSAEGKVGASFESLHEDVKKANGQLVISNPGRMARMMALNPKTMERVGAVTFRRDTEMNSHPDLPSNKVWDAQDPRLFVRFERQTMTGLPAIKSFFFTVKTYFVQADKNNSTCDAIINGLESAGPDIYARQFVQNHKSEVIQWLQSRKV